MDPVTLHPFFQTLYRHIRNYADGEDLWSDKAASLQASFETDIDTIDELLALAHQTRRLISVYDAGLQHSSAFAQALTTTNILAWRDFRTPPASEDLQDGLVNMLYPDEAGQDECVMFHLGDQARLIGRRLVEKALDDGLDFRLSFSDPNFGSLLINHADASGIDGLARAKLAEWHDITRVIHAGPCTPREHLIDFNESNAQDLRQKTATIAERKARGDIAFRLTAIPTEGDAEYDGFDYASYTQLYFELCDQPWEYIDAAHQVLIGWLDAARTITISNADGTHISLDLIDNDGRPFTFCNSRTQRNIPGSEVFSAPRRDGVNGRIVARGRFSPRAGEIIENLTMHFQDGYLYDFEAEEGAEHFQAFLDRNSLHRYVGELGIGTNPHLKRHVLNGLLVEKISGSFHVALGGCYTMTSYDGRDVHVNNGNFDTANPPEHWDITTMLHGRGGKIWLDDALIMDNGLFVAPDLDVLNRGWAAVPVDERPKRWRDYQGPEHGLGAPKDRTCHKQSG